ncbi:MAG: hemolysin family protein [Acidobacteriota bacterium]
MLIFILETMGILVLLSFSAFFSGSETAFFSLRKWRVERLRGTGIRGAAVSELLSNPRGLIATILIGNETVNIAASNLAAILRRDYFSAFGTAGIFVALVAMTLMLFLFGEVTPKVVAIYNQERWCLGAAIPMRLVCRVLSPLRKAVEKLIDRCDALSNKIGRQIAKGVSLGELRTIVRESAGERGLSLEEVKIIDSIFEIMDMPVKTVMVPRPRIICLREDASLDDALTVARKTKFSRFPVYGKDMDDIKGVVYAKDLLAAQYGLSHGSMLRDFLKPIIFVPETKAAFELLRDFQVKKLHIAAVLDEYGGTEGIVTIDDILREIVGEMGDRYRPSKYRFKKVSEKAFLLDGAISIQEFSELSGELITDPDVKTMAGHFIKLLGRIPAEGDRVSDALFDYRVVRMSGRRLAVLEAKKSFSNPGMNNG